MGNADGRGAAVKGVKTKKGIGCVVPVPFSATLPTKEGCRLLPYRQIGIWNLKGFVPFLKNG
jgi:hypothetical protein